MVVSSSIVALKQFQKEMEGEAERAELYSEEDVITLCREVRHDLAQKRHAEHAQQRGACVQDGFSLDT